MDVADTRPPIPMMLPGGKKCRVTSVGSADLKEGGRKSSFIEEDGDSPRLFARGT
jgi:hypothetical protein